MIFPWSGAAAKNVESGKVGQSVPAGQAGQGGAKGCCECGDLLTSIIRHKSQEMHVNSDSVRKIRESAPIIR